MESLAVLGSILLAASKTKQKCSTNKGQCSTLGLGGKGVIISRPGEAEIEQGTQRRKLHGEDPQRDPAHADLCLLHPPNSYPFRPLAKINQKPVDQKAKGSPS